MKSGSSVVALPLLFFIAGIGVAIEMIVGAVSFLLLVFLLLRFSDKLKFSIESIRLSLRTIFIGLCFFFLGKMNVILNAEQLPPPTEKLYFSALQLKIDEGLKFTEKGCWTVAPAFDKENEFDVLVNMDSANASTLEKGDTLLLHDIEVFPLLRPGHEPSPWDLYLLRQGIYYKMYLRDEVEVRKNRSWLYWLYNLSHRKIGASDLSVKSKALLLSLLIGDRGYIDKRTKEDYAVLGVSHILSVSGLHVGVIYIIISWMLGLVLSRRSVLSIVLVLLLIWFYCWMVGFSPPVLRSAIMFSLYVIAKAIGRSNTLLHTTCLSAFVILLINPLYLYDIGFQLTYAAMLGIIFILPFFQDFCRPKKVVVKSVVDLVFLSIAVQITLLPFLVYYFEYLSVYFVLANLVIVPVVALLMYAGIVFLLLPVNGVLSWVIDHQVLFMDWFCITLCHWPYTTVPVVVTSLLCWVLYAVSLGFFLQYGFYRLNIFLFSGVGTLLLSLLSA
ncbi:MAG: ComEC/Rec2 family competence protein [Flavobacteriales bacterium]